MKEHKDQTHLHQVHFTTFDVEFLFDNKLCLIQEQLREIFNTTLSSIICRNSDNVSVSQRFVMKKVSKTNNMEQCKELDTFSFKPWKEIKKSSVRFDTRQSNVKTMKKEHSGN